MKKYTLHIRIYTHLFGWMLLTLWPHPHTPPIFVESVPLGDVAQPICQHLQHLDEKKGQNLGKSHGIILEAEVFRAFWGGWFPKTLTQHFEEFPTDIVEPTTTKNPSKVPIQSTSPWSSARISRWAAYQVGKNQLRELENHPLFRWFVGDETLPGYGGIVVSHKKL